MITNQNTEIIHDEIIIDTEILCTQLESGNPFSSNQDIAFLKNGSQTTDSPDGVCTLEKRSIHSKRILHFFESGLKNSLSRLSKNPNSKTLLNSIAQNQIKSGLIDDAIETLKKAYDIDRSFFPTIANLAECYAKMGESKKALELYQQISEDKQNDVRVLTNTALIYMRERKFEKALSLLEKANTLYPKNSNVLNNLGIVFLTRKEPNKAIHFLRKASRLNTDDYAIFNNLGVAFAAIHNYAKALKNFKIAYSINQSDRNVIRNLANAYKWNEKYDSLIELLDEYVKTTPEDIELRDLLCLSFFESGLYKKCLTELHKTLLFIKEENIKQIASTYNNIATTLIKLNRIKEAKSFFLNSLEVNPKPKVETLYNMIDFFVSINDYETMKPLLDHSLSRYKDDPYLISFLGTYYSNSQKYDDAIELFYKALEIDNTLLDPYLNLSVIECDVHGNYEKAIELTKKGMEFHPKNLTILNNYAYFCIMKNDLLEARKILDNIDAPNNIYLNATKGLLYLKKGDVEEGRRLYNKAASLARDNSNLYALVNQKKYLELANYYFEKGDIKSALQSLKKCKTHKTIEHYYKTSIDELTHKLESFNG